MPAKPKPGSPEAKKAFYHQQRLTAERTGDNKTTAKIYDKLNASKYGPQAASDKNFASKRAEYMANEMTRPKDKVYKAAAGHKGK
jgi:hypothetical protein